MQSGGAAGDSNPLKWSLKRVLQWLSDLGMDHLKETFAKNHVDGEQLMVCHDAYILLVVEGLASDNC